VNFNKLVILHRDANVVNIDMFKYFVCKGIYDLYSKSDLYIFNKLFSFVFYNFGMIFLFQVCWYFHVIYYSTVNVQRGVTLSDKGE